MLQGKKKIYRDWRAMKSEDYFNNLSKLENKSLNKTEKIQFDFDFYEINVYLEPITQFFSKNIHDINYLKAWKNFVNEITSRKDLIITTPLSNSTREELREKEINFFDKVTDKKSMITFLDSFPTLYHQLCKFLLLNPIDIFGLKIDPTN